MERLDPYIQSTAGGDWKDCITKAYFDRVNLSATGFYKYAFLLNRLISMNVCWKRRKRENVCVRMLVVLLYALYIVHCDLQLYRLDCSGTLPLVESLTLINS